MRGGFRPGPLETTEALVTKRGFLLGLRPWALVTLCAFNFSLFGWACLGLSVLLYFGDRSLVF